MIMDTNLLKMMSWNVMLPTCIDFLLRYFQYASFCSPIEIRPLSSYLIASNVVVSDEQVLVRRFDPMCFAKAASMLDQAVSDYDSLKFSNSILAASAFWYSYPQHNSNSMEIIFPIII